MNPRRNGAPRVPSTWAITLDIDWAPDWAIHAVAELFITYAVKSTWFVTHETPALAVLRAHPEFFELGLHPNCMHGSTHGQTEDQVLTHVRQIVPEAVSMRTHGLYQTTNFLLKAASHGVRNDVSLFLPGVVGLSPHCFAFHQLALKRVPYFWEDLHELSSGVPDWSMTRWLDDDPGLKVFNFHPAHIVLNSGTVDAYNAVKDLGPLQELSQLSAKPHISDGKGVGSLLKDLLPVMRGGGATIRELCERTVGGTTL